jgi:hypothetical protein
MLRLEDIVKDRKVLYLWCIEAVVVVSRTLSNPWDFQRPSGVCGIISAEHYMPRRILTARAMLDEPVVWF